MTCFFHLWWNGWISFFSPEPPAVSMLSVSGSVPAHEPGVFIQLMCAKSRVKENIILKSDKGLSITP